MWVAGVDARFDLGAFGYLYGAYSHVGLDNAITVARAIEVIHSSGGGEFGLGVVDNYLGPSCVSTQFGTDTPEQQGKSYYPRPISAGTNGVYAIDEFSGTRTCSHGNGRVDTLLAQYEFSLTNFLQQSSGGQKFWGDGQDLYLKLLRHVQQGPQRLRAQRQHSQTQVRCRSVGFDPALVERGLTLRSLAAEQQGARAVLRHPFAPLGVQVQLNTHEAITLQYSRYMYNQRECKQVSYLGDPTKGAAASTTAGSPADGVYDVGPSEDLCVQPPSSPVPTDGFGSAWPANAGQRGAPTTRPDVNVFKIEATMWW